MSRGDPRRPRLRAAAGLALLALGQAATLVHVKPYSEYWYSLVWFGFILFVDALVAWRTGASLVGARPRELGIMLAASAAIWWLFEIANHLHLASWSYTPSPDVPMWAQRLRSTVAFASLLPANVEAALLGLALFPPPDAPAPSSSRASGVGALALVAGAVLLTAAWRVADLALPLGLAGAFLAIDGSNALRGRPSLARDVADGRPRAALALFFSNVAAGVLGEAWNYPADPKWVYDAPYAGPVKLFEMPLPGYLGYGALSLALFAGYHAVRPRRTGDRASARELALLGLT